MLGGRRVRHSFAAGAHHKVAEGERHIGLAGRMAVEAEVRHTARAGEHRTADAAEEELDSRRTEVAVEEEGGRPEEDKENRMEDTATAEVVRNRLAVVDNHLADTLLAGDIGPAAEEVDHIHLVEAGIGLEEEDTVVDRSLAAVLRNS